MKAKKTNESCEKIIFIGVLILIFLVGFTAIEATLKFADLKTEKTTKK